MRYFLMNLKAFGVPGVFAIASLLLCLRATPQQITATAPLTYSRIATATSSAAGLTTIVAPSQTVTVSASAVTASSQIFVQYDESTGGGCSANMTLESDRYYVQSRTAGTGFVIKAAVAPPTGTTACLSYFIVN